MTTGRTCDGYESPFRLSTSQSISKAYAGAVTTKPGPALQPIKPTLSEITPDDIDLLNRYFSTKTIFDVKLGCDEEAKQILQASLTDPPIRDAVSSLKALREHLETSGEFATSATPQTPHYGYDYGLQQYCAALKGLASRLSSPGTNGLKSALLCCQIFISIEQVRGNHAVMAQHIIQGLGIMRESGARPNLDATNKLVPAHHTQLPLLDVFIIKLFSAPCKFAEPSGATDDANGMEVATCLTAVDQQTMQSQSSLRAIAPNMRTELTRIAVLTLEFLDKVLHVESTEDALLLLSEKTSLLESLASWLIDVKLADTDVKTPGPEPVSVFFLRSFHQILKIVLFATLDSSPRLYTDLQTENDQLQAIASIIDERLKDYKVWIGTRSGGGELKV